MPSLTAGHFFVVRVARLPITTLLRTPSEPNALRSYLYAWSNNPLVREALNVAAPSFVRRLSAQKNPEEIENFQQALLKYLIRMSTRPTPFGLFAGVAPGEFDDTSSIVCGSPDGDRKETRLDMSFLNTIRNQAAKNLSEVPVSPNPTIHPVDKNFHYIEGFIDNSLQRYRLSSVEADQYVCAVLEFSRSKKFVNDIVKKFISNHPDVDLDEARNFITSMVNEGLLVPDIPLPITGVSPEVSLAHSLEMIGNKDVAHNLREVTRELHSIDASSTNSEPQYDKALARAKRIISNQKIDNLFQVDLKRNLHAASLNRQSLSHLMESLPLMISDKRQTSPITSRFIQEFNVRHEGEFVPLLQALDEQIGFPFGATTHHDSYLLKNINFNQIDIEATSTFERDLTPLQKRLVEALRLPKNMLLPKLDLRNPVIKGEASALESAPFSFSLLTSVYKDQNQEIIHYKSSSGPSGANLIGRFCHLDDGLLRATREYLNQESDHSPEVIFAEIAHLPQGRAGNVIARPLLSAYEIVFLGDSNLPEEKRIDIADLFVGILGNEIALWSKRLNKRIIPRLSSAHNFSNNAMTIYKLLASIAGQTRRVPSFALPEQIRNARIIPRICYGNVILHERQWCVPRQELLPLANPEKNAGHFADLARKYDIGRYVAYSNRDNVLVIDLQSPIMASVLLKESIQSEEVTLRESLATTLNSIAVTSHEDELLPVANEIVIPISNEYARPYQAIQSPQYQRAGNHSNSLPSVPGSDWLSLKIYGGASLLDNLLLDTIWPVATKFMGSGELSKFFFIRYADPDWHLRVRFKADSSFLYGVLLPSLHEKLKRLVAHRIIDRIDIFTYFKETDRYGGPEAIELAESLFTIDSLSTLSMIGGIHERDRWKVAVLSAIAFMRDFGLTNVEAMQTVDALRLAFGREFRETIELRKQLGARFKELHVNDVIDGPNEEFIRGKIAGISDSIRNVGSHYQRLSRAGLLCKPLTEISASLLHMKMNRIFVGDNRRHELVIYDFLRRHYLTLTNRSRGP